MTFCHTPTPTPTPTVTPTETALPLYGDCWKITIYSNFPNRSEYGVIGWYDINGVYRDTPDNINKPATYYLCTQQGKKPEFGPITVANSWELEQMTDCTLGAYIGSYCTNVSTVLSSLSCCSSSFDTTPVPTPTIPVSSAQSFTTETSSSLIDKYQLLLAEIALAKGILDKLKNKKADLENTASALRQAYAANPTAEGKKALDRALATQASTTSEITSQTNKINTLQDGLKNIACLINEAIFGELNLPDISFKMPDLSNLWPPKLPSLPQFNFPSVSVNLKTLLAGIPSLPSLAGIIPSCKDTTIDGHPPFIEKDGNGGFTSNKGSYKPGKHIVENFVAVKDISAPLIAASDKITAPAITTGTLVANNIYGALSPYSISFLPASIQITTPILNVTGNVNVTGLVRATLFSANAKLFDIPHPTKEKMRLRHGCLEGPEHAVYIRGKSDNPIIALPDFWKGLVHTEDYTVHLTATSDTQHLFVHHSYPDCVYVSGSNGLPFYYYIVAERKDMPKLIVETYA